MRASSSNGANLKGENDDETKPMWRMRRTRGTDVRHISVQKTVEPTALLVAMQELQTGQRSRSEEEKIKQEMEPVVDVRPNAQGKGVDGLGGRMKKGKWETLHLRDVKKGMQVVCCEAGRNPKGCKPHKITDVGFWILGSITIKLDNDYMISIVDLISRQRQLFQWIPLTIEDKYERLTKAVERYVGDIRLENCPCFLELAKLVEEYEES